MIRLIAAGFALSAAALASAPALAGLLGGGASASAAVNVNTAGVNDLVGAGLSKVQAEAIVAGAKVDPFDSVDELKAEVSGVTDATLLKLKGALVVGDDVVGKVKGALNVNTATTAELDKIGFSLEEAKAIVAARKSDAFDTVDELKAEVSGITDDTLAKLDGPLSVGFEVVGNVSSILAGATNAAGGLLNAVGNTAGGLVNTALAPVNVNTATVAQLQQMGLSLQAANSIVATIKKNGPVTSLDALASLPGVDAKQLGSLSAQGSLTVQ